MSEEAEHSQTGSQAGHTGRALVSGTFWISLSEAMTTLMGVVSNIVAARIVAPAQFGIMATVTLTVAILETFTTSGFDEALVQREGDVSAYLDTVWSWNVLRGLVFVVLLAGAGPLLAAWYV